MYINALYHSIPDNYKETISELKVLGDSTYNMSLIQKAATDTTLCHYGMSQCSTLSEARALSWERKMARNALEPPSFVPSPLLMCHSNRTFLEPILQQRQ